MPGLCGAGPIRRCIMGGVSGSVLALVSVRAQSTHTDQNFKSRERQAFSINLYGCYRNSLHHLSRPTPSPSPDPSPRRAETRRRRHDRTATRWTARRRPRPSYGLQSRRGPILATSRPVQSSLATPWHFGRGKAFRFFRQEEEDLHTAHTASLLKGNVEVVALAVARAEPGRTDGSRAPHASEQWTVQ